MNVRVLRGQVVVRELRPEPSPLWTPDPRARETKTHHGIVIACGPGCLINGIEQAMGFGTGDVIQYHFRHHQEAATRPWPLDGLEATWIPQGSVDGVWVD